MRKLTNAFSIVIIWLSLQAQCLVMAEISKPAAHNVSQQTLRYLTEHSPFGSKQDRHGNAYSVSAEFVTIVKQRLGERGNIEILPWARAYEIAVSTPDIALLETIKTAEREQRFKWVGPILRYPVNLYGRKETMPAQASLATILQDYVVCETRHTGIVLELLSMGFVVDENLIITRQAGDCYEMMSKNRADLTAINTMLFDKRRQGLLNIGLDLLPVYPLKSIELYIAFSTNVANERIDKWQCELEQAVSDGTMRQLYQQYFPKEMIADMEQHIKQNPKC